MKDAPAFDFYPSDWLSGTLMMSCEEKGLYVDLLAMQWEDGCLPPEEKLKRIRVKPSVLTAVLEKFPVGEDGKRRNARLERERMKQRDRRERKAEGARKTNAKRWHSESLSDRLATPERPFSDPFSESPPITNHQSPIEVEREPQAQAGPPVSESEAWAFARNLPQSPQWTEAAVGKWWSTRDRDGWHTGGATPRPITAESWRSDLRASHSWATKTERRRENELPANKTHVPTEALF